MIARLDLLTVLENLVRNALRAMDETVGKDIQIVIRRAGARLEIRFADSGRRLPQDIAPRIFHDRFHDGATR